MNNEDLVSIIIPVYNVEEYVEKCLQSLQAQTYKNIEIILINDGSTDNSKILCEKYREKDKRFKLVDKENEGVSKARNIGIEQANGKYITFVDSDDYIDEHYVDCLYKQIIENNADISICGTIDIKENGEYIQSSKKYKNNINSTEALKELLNEEYYTSVVWSKMYKKEIIGNIRFNTNLKVAEDLEFLYQVIKNANIINVNTKNTLYYYRIRENSLTAPKYNKDWEKEIQLCKEILDDCQENKKEILPNAIRRYIRINTSCMIKILKYCKEDTDTYEKLRNNINGYKKVYIKEFNVKLKSKIKMILLLHYKKISSIIFK